MLVQQCLLSVLILALLSNNVTNLFVLGRAIENVNKETNQRIIRQVLKEKTLEGQYTKCPTNFVYDTETSKCVLKDDGAITEGFGNGGLIGK